MVDEIARLNERGNLVGNPAGAELIVDLAAISSDGFEVRGRARLVVRVAAGEERVVRQSLMAGKTSLCARDVEAAWNGRLRSAFDGPEKRPAEAWVNGVDPLRAALAKAAGNQAYVSGLEVLGEVRLTVESPAWAAWCEGERRRAERERLEAARVESARRMGEVLSELRGKGIAGSATLARAGNEEGQAILLAALGQEGGARVWAASGFSVAEVTRAGSVRAIELGGALGSLRSVFPEGEDVLAGARDGIWSVRGEERLAYRDDPMAVEHGFATVARCGEAIVAAHRQRGIVWWRSGDPASPAGKVRPAAPWGPWSALLPRGPELVLAGGMGLEEVSLSTGERRFIAALTARCVLLAEVDGRVAAVCEDGVVRLYESVDLRPAGEVRVGEPVGSAAVMPWVGGTRILCATSSAVVSLGVEDAVVVRYLSPHRGVKEVAGGRGVVVGISPDRMRAVLWDAWNPASPAAEVHVGNVTRGRVSDVAIA